MILQFPHETAFLPRTKLCYINLTRLLNDGKRDRTARVSGFVAIHIGETCYLIFLRNGEPFHAARLSATSREPMPIAEVQRIAATEIDHGESGSIGYYGAPEAQLQMMLATIVAPPVLMEHGLNRGVPERLFPALRSREFTGVVELSGRQEVHYLRFQGGEYRAGFFCGRKPGTSLAEFLPSIFDSAGDDLRIGLFAAPTDLPMQAPPGLVELYCRLLQTVMVGLAEQSGPAAAKASVYAAQARLAGQHPVLTTFEVVDGEVRGEPMVPAEELTDAIAAWLTEVLANGADAARIDPVELIERATRDDRYALAEQGFFHLIPWPIAS